MSESPATPDMFSAPGYPGADATPAAARSWIFWKLGLTDFAAPGAYLDDEALLAGIRQYGATVIAGKNPAGRVETLEELFLRAIGKPVTKEGRRR